MATSGTIRGVLASNAPLPAGLDGARIALWQLRSGNTYEQVRSMLGAGFQQYNEEMITAWGDAITTTTEGEYLYPNGGTLIPFEQLSGLSRVPLVKGYNAGHSLDLAVYGQGIGGTWREFEDMTEAQLIASVRGIVQAGRNLFDRSIFVRAFTPTDNLLGTNGYDVGFANGSPLSGSGGPAYAPPAWGGQTFPITHNHYIAVNSSVSSQNLGDLLDQLALTLNHHGLAGPYKAYVSEADVTTYRALTSYVLPVDDINVIDRGGATTGAQFFDPGTAIGATVNTGGRYIGAYNGAYGIVRLYATYRIPTLYVWMYMPGPALSPLNAIGVRYRSTVGLGFRIVEIPDFNTTFPVKEIDVEIEFGVSSGPNRYAAAVGQLRAGSTTYQIPVIA